MSEFSFRENTHDERIFRSVYDYNEYALPDTFGDSSVIMDVGAHIGSFSYACLKRGAKRAYAFEPDAENYALGYRNLAHYRAMDTCEFRKVAIWRSDIPCGQLDYSGYSYFDNKINTGGGNVFGGAEKVDAISLNTATQHVLARQLGFSDYRGVIDLLKLDCEGSEFPILLSRPDLSRFKAICGEFHEFGGDYDQYSGIPETIQVPGYDKYTIEVLSDTLYDAGFDVVVHRRPPLAHIGLFWAWRTNERDFSVRNYIR